MQKIVLGFISVLLTLALLAWVLLRIPNYNIKGVHPALLVIKQPVSSATAHYYFDGGSIGLELIDSDGKSLAFALPVKKTNSSRQVYRELVTGVTHSSKSGGVTHPCSEDSRRFVAMLIDKYADQGIDRMLCLNHLRDAHIDRLRTWWFRRTL